MDGATRQPLAVVGGRRCTGLVDLTDDLAALDSEGFWAVVLPYSGPPVCARFGEVVPLAAGAGPAETRGASASGPTAPPMPVAPRWRTSLDLDGHRRAVGVVRDAIAAGDVYQVNLTRRLSASLEGHQLDVEALGAALDAGNPAPYSAVVRLPDRGIALASASPELFLGRDGRDVWSSPIKGTAATTAGLTAKDRAENVMIVDLVRNDLGRVCEWGSVTVPSLLAVEDHPGLVHLVSTVRGRLRPGLGWAELIDATFPPGSVTGAPKVAACGLIDRLEPVARGIYCGAVGWVDADAGRGELNVAIRTFWVEDGRLHFGTGGAITWDSDPADEWSETELKAANLLAVAGSGAGPVAGADAATGAGAAVGIRP